MNELTPEPMQKVFNDGLIGMTEYVMPIVLVLSLMAVFAFRIVLFNGTRINKYMLYISIITTVLIGIGIVLTNIKEEIAEPIISSITTIITVLFAIQAFIQLKLRKK